MIITVDVECIFVNSDSQDLLQNFARPILTALKSMGYKICVTNCKEPLERVKKALQIEMIPFDSINSLPKEENHQLSYVGVIRIENKNSNIIMFGRYRRIDKLFFIYKIYNTINFKQ